MNEQPIFRVENFGVSFSQYVNGISRKDLCVITDLDIELYKGKILAVVGSSGSGKSLLAHGIMDILPENAIVHGKMFYNGNEISEQERDSLRGNKICLIPQSVNYLDPLLKVGKQVELSIKEKDKKVKKQMVLDTFSKYGLKEEVYDYYPHQLSGGMARRVLLSTATLSKSEIIIADEPTPGLDIISLNEVLEDFRRITDSGAAVLMITHDINAARKIADTVAIFYAGTTLEIANMSDFEGNGEKLRHPYTKALYRAMPDKDFIPIDGTAPMPGEQHKGCIFAERCSNCSSECLEQVPELKDYKNGKVRCLKCC